MQQNTTRKLAATMSASMVSDTSAVSVPSMRARAFERQRFVTCDYGPPQHGIEVQGADGVWHAATVYTHTTSGDVVLWYAGEDMYEGIGSQYRWGSNTTAAACMEQQLLDGDGCVIKTRYARAGLARRIAEREYLPFRQALVHARSVKLAGKHAWGLWCMTGARPSNLPCHPDRAYAHEGWEGWAHWLGTGRHERDTHEHRLPLEGPLVSATTRPSAATESTSTAPCTHNIPVVSAAAAATSVTPGTSHVVCYHSSSSSVPSAADVTAANIADHILPGTLSGTTSSVTCDAIAPVTTPFLSHVPTIDIPPQPRASPFSGISALIQAHEHIHSDVQARAQVKAPPRATDAIASNTSSAWPDSQLCELARFAMKPASLVAHTKKRADKTAAGFTFAGTCTHCFSAQKYSAQLRCLKRNRGNRSAVRAIICSACHKNQPDRNECWTQIPQGKLPTRERAARIKTLDDIRDFLQEVEIAPAAHIKRPNDFKRRYLFEKDTNRVCVVVRYQTLSALLYARLISYKHVRTVIIVHNHDPAKSAVFHFEEDDQRHGSVAGTIATFSRNSSVASSLTSSQTTPATTSATNAPATSIRVSKDQFLPFKKALMYARSLKLISSTEWRALCKSGSRPANVPSRPDTIYKHEGWQGWGHWLGTGNLVGGKQDFLPFKKALMRARSLKLKSMKEWEAWCTSGVREANMPSRPDKAYTHEGWQGYGHWLGNGNPNTKELLPFEEAMLFARFLKLNGVKGWGVWSSSGARPANIPSAPDRVYKHDGWQGYGHWLGNGDVAGGGTEEFLPFEKALLHARSLKLKGQAAWYAWSNSVARPANIPVAPDQVYKHEGWQGYGHWLGTGNIQQGKQEYLPFDEALLYAHSLKLKGEKAWRVWCKSEARPVNIPPTPERTYKHEGWQGYGHWLGTGNIQKGKQVFLPFSEALSYARSLKLKGRDAWRVWCTSGARPANIPSTPNIVYTHEGWQGYGHWLGTGNVAPKDRQFWPFKKALLYARALKLKGVKEWNAWSKSSVREDNVPFSPDATYKHDGWQGYGHWLGTVNKRGGQREFLPFDEALLYARSLKLKCVKEWNAWCKTEARLAKMPSCPNSVYKHEGWQGYGHWLGTVNKRGGQPFEKVLLCRAGAASAPHVPSGRRLGIRSLTRTRYILWDTWVVCSPCFRSRNYHDARPLQHAWVCRVSATPYTHTHTHTHTRYTHTYTPHTYTHTFLLAGVHPLRCSS